MWWLILHHFYRASIRKAWVHTLSTRGGEKNDATLTAVCMRPPFRLRGQHGDRDLYVHQDITETLHFSHCLLHLGRKDMRPCQLLDDIVLFRRKPQTEPGND